MKKLLYKRVDVTDSKVTPSAAAVVKKTEQDLVQTLDEFTPVTDLNHSRKSRLVSPQEQIDRLVEQFGVLGAQVGFYKARKLYAVFISQEFIRSSGGKSHQPFVQTLDVLQKYKGWKIMLSVYAMKSWS